MKYNKINRIIRNSIFVVFLFNCYIYSQCDSGYTYFSDSDIPEDVSNQSNCFDDVDLSVINELITINSLSYTTPLDVGNQTWINDRLFSWTLTYGPPGAASGISEKLLLLPDNIGELSELTTLYIEKHDLIELPASFTSLSKLINLYISSNWLTNLPEDFDNLTSLYILDLGYNKLESVPASIGNLNNLVYLFLFNNQLTSLPEAICDLNLDWDGIGPTNWPYFASGGNYLCDSELIPDCVENSANFEINMDQNYYSFPLEEPQICCPELGDINNDDTWNVLDIVTLANCVLANNCADLESGCAGDMNGDGGYNVLDIVTLANCVLADSCGG